MVHVEAIPIVDATIEFITVIRVSVETCFVTDYSIVSAARFWCIAWFGTAVTA